MALLLILCSASSCSAASPLASRGISGAAFALVNGVGPRGKFGTPRSDDDNVRRADSDGGLFPEKSPVEEFQSVGRMATRGALGDARGGLSDIGRPESSSVAGDREGGGGGTTAPNWKERIDASIAKSRKIRGSNYVQISTIDAAAMEPRCRTVVFRGFLKGVPAVAMREVMGMGGFEGGGSYGGDGNCYDCIMKMITDARSSKVRELGAFHESRRGGKREGIGDSAEMVWWFPKSSEQYRIRGRLQFVGDDGPLYSRPYAVETGSEEGKRYMVAERKQQWGNLSDLAREQFFWEDPGLPYLSARERGGDDDGVGLVPPGGRDGDGRVLPPPETFLLMLLYPTRVDYLRLGDNYRQVDQWDVGGSRWVSARVNP